MRSRRLVLLLGLVTGFLVVGYGAWLWSRVAQSSETPIAGVVLGIALAVFILWRQPGNRMGRLLIVLGMAGAVSFAAEAIWHVYGAPVDHPPSYSLWAVKVAAASATLGFGLMLAVVPTVFPDGRPRSGASRLVLRLAYLVIGAQALSLLLSGGSLCVSEEPSTSACLRRIDGMPGLDWLPNLGEPPFEYVMGPLIVVVIAGGLVSAVARYRASTGVEQAQMKWFALGAFVSLALIPPAIVLNATTGYVMPDWLFNVPFSLLPLSIAVAVLRYRLYEIDRIISRTVSYALVAGLLAVVFSAGVVLIPNALPGFADSPLLVAVSTLAVAALFNPIRKRIQLVVDRRFNRSRYDAERVMDQFAGSLRDRVDPDGVVEGWVGVVSETMEPEAVGVWVRG